MPNYQNGKLYKLVNNVDDKIYVGSTVTKLSTRMSGHRIDSRKEPNRKVYKHLNPIGMENVEIILLEYFPCNTVEELNARERYWIELLKPELNKQVPTRTRKEYEELRKHTLVVNPENVEKNAKSNEWKKKNPEKVKVQRHKYNETKGKEKYTCTCGSTVSLYHKARHERTVKHIAFIENKV